MNTDEIARSYGNSEIRYNKVLAPILPFRKYETDNSRIAVVDGSVLTYILEELVALSAVEVVFHDQRVTDFIESLPAAFKNRVKIVDDNKVKNQIYGLFMLLAEEFNFEFHISGSFTSYSNTTCKEIMDHILFLYLETINLLCGVEFESEIDINIDEMKESTSFIRMKSRNMQARAILSSFEGILNTYKLNPTPSLKMLSDASLNLTIDFTRILDDESYKQMSMHAHFLGKPNLMQHSLISMRRIAEDITNSKKFKNLFNLGSKTIKTVFNIPIPDSEFAESILRKNFLPPIVPMKEAVKKAYENWREDKPDIIFPKGASPEVIQAWLSMQREKRTNNR